MHLEIYWKMFTKIDPTVWRRSVWYGQIIKRAFLGTSPQRKHRPFNFEQANCEEKNVKRVANPLTKGKAGRSRLTKNANLRNHMQIRQMFYSTVEDASSHSFIVTLPKATCTNPKTHAKKGKAGRSRLTKNESRKIMHTLRGAKTHQRPSTNLGWRDSRSDYKFKSP